MADTPHRPTPAPTPDPVPPGRGIGGRRRSLRRALFTAGATTAALVLVTWLAVVLLTVEARREASRAQEAFLQADEMADRVQVAVLDQVLLVARLPREDVEPIRRELDTTGRRIGELVESYLAGDPDPLEARQLQRIQVEHAGLSSAAHRVLDLLEVGATDAAGPALAALIERSIVLRREVSDFVGMREARLATLREREAGTSALLYLAGGAFSLVLVGGLGYGRRFLRTRVTEPLDEVVVAAGRLEAGDLDARVPTGHDAELAELARSFNRMAASLRATRDRLEERNRQLVDALDRILSVQTELIEAEKTSAMGRMMGGLAHHLNNPLASVLGHAELLDRKLEESDVPLDPDEIRRSYLAPVVADARRARALIRNVLRFVRPSTGGLDAVDPRRALEVVLGLRHFEFDHAGLEIQVGTIPDAAVQAEEQRLQEVLLAVVNNALDAMAPRGEGTLHVEGGVEGDRVMLEFRDEGPGLERPDRVFEPFYSTRPPGEATGLGLALVQRYMAEFGGAVEVENVPDGPGARVRLHFRAAPHGVPPRGPGDDRADPSRPGATPEATAPERPSPRARADAPTGPPRILVVEDETPIRSLEARLLRRLGAEVATAANADEARDILATGPHVDLVVSDVRMPGESGIELYRWVEAEHPALAGSFLFVTGDVSDPEVAELAARRPGMFLRKPFEMDEYLRRVSGLLSGEDASA